MGLSRAKSCHNTQRRWHLNELMMNKMTNQPLKKLVHAMLPLLLVTTSAQAADTDVYLNQSSTVTPNVMFSMDTSGSMQAWYTTMNAPPEYSPTGNYSGSFDTNRFYVSTDGRIPATATGLATAPLQSLAGCNFSVSPMAADGFTSVRVAVAIASSSSSSLPKNIWLPANKVYFETSNANDIFVECSDDSGNHGSASGTGGSYANSSPSGSTDLYTNSSLAEIDWDKYPYVTLFSGRYLNYKANPPADISMAREVLQNRVIRDAVKRTPDVAAGLARMVYGQSAGAIIRAAKDNSVRANQTELLNTLANTIYGGGTPLSTQLLEIMHYYHGKQINRSEDYLHGSTYNNIYANYYGRRAPTDPAARSGGTYISPIKYECQKNYVILVTDGQPSGDWGSTTDFKASNSSLYPDYAAYTGKSVCTEGNCLDEVAGYMSKADASPSLPNTYDLDGDSVPDGQTVKVYPIGMEIQQAVLDDAALAAGTESYYAADATEFENAFIEILANIKASGGVSMVTAASSSDRFSKTSDRDFLYYGQFVPTNNFQWQGNLKKYRYAYTADGVAYITDSDITTNPDITADDGSIVASARSYWSTSADGNDSLRGGVLDKLKARGPTGRLIRGINSNSDVAVPIMTDDNILSTGNAVYTAGVNANDRSAAERQEILNYAIGQDVHDADQNGNTSEQRGSIGGIVRSSPVAIQYGGTSANPEVVVFATTTDGVLHAFSDETGKELWAIVMPEAYSKLATQYDNFFSSAPWWGIDGSISSRVIDKNNNGIIESGDKVYLYISGGMSMRRWFMLDVTNATASSNQATLIRRGKYDGTNASWDELGLATAQMVPMSYRLNGDAAGVTRKAMIYANGWDPVAEFNYLTENTMGRGISLYDSETGSPLWQMTRNHGAANMKYAFATQPTPVDINGDGYTDLIYAVDVNARLWRFNVNNGANNASNLIDGAILAKLGTTGDTLSEQRRTYKRVDAATVNTGTGTEVLLAIGTGDRMNPTATSVQDRLHVIRDKTATSGVKPTSSEILTESNFYDATSNVIGEGGDSAKQSALVDLNAASGWYIDLPPGTEKAISAPLISAGIANFSVYKVGGTSPNPCEDSSMGTGLLYRVNVLDGTAAADYDGDGNLTASDRFTQIRGLGIPGDVGFHTSSSGVKTIIVNRDPFINRPDPNDPSKNATPDDAFRGDSAGYWFECTQGNCND